MKKILDVGNCEPDHATVTRFFTANFDCKVARAHKAEDALAQLKADSFDLVLVNRKLDIDYTDGIDVIKQIKADPEIAGVPVMLITNYAEHQEAAESVGAIRGFGKLEYDHPETLERVRRVLD